MAAPDAADPTTHPHARRRHVGEDHRAQADISQDNNGTDETGMDVPAIDGAAAANMLRDDLTSRRRTFVLYIFAIIALSWSCGWQMYEYAFNESTNAALHGTLYLIGALYFALTAARSFWEVSTTREEVQSQVAAAVKAALHDQVAGAVDSALRRTGHAT